MCPLRELPAGELMVTPIDRVEVAVLELWARANPARDDVAVSYRQALRAVLHVIDAEQGVTRGNAPGVNS